MIKQRLAASRGASGARFGAAGKKTGTIMMQNFLKPSGAPWHGKPAIAEAEPDLSQGDRAMGPQRPLSAAERPVAR